MSVALDLGGLERLTKRLETVSDIDAEDLMISWTKVMEDDNRRGILAGLDKDGVPMAPVKYRPKEGVGHRVGTRLEMPTGKHVSKDYKQRIKTLRETLKRFRLGQNANIRQGKSTMHGPYASGLHNNLTTAEYELLGGPPLAPRDQFSRVITNYKTDHAKLRPGLWATTFWWEDVVSTKGVSFLRYHFDGTGKLPRRDLRGIRPAGIEKALEALRNWSRTKIHEHFGK